MAELQSTTSNLPRSREVRLGVVMYGGVSLAIYIYGAARELFDAVRGRSVFKLIKALTDSDIVVDVISGTSAGGINGVLLAFCLTNELEFADASSTWRDEGAIRTLLRDPLRDTEPRSVLRGDAHFLKQLIATFRRLSNRKIDAANGKEPEDPSPTGELDLFVTTTDVDGRIERWLDAAGHPIDVKDHRIVFHLKHRPGRKEPLSITKGKSDPESLFVALGRLARATSSFPAAFEPVELGGKDTPDEKLLSEWGWGPAGMSRNGFFVDGGVLDNKPFTPTIREIFHRLSDRLVERKLFYIEPDPERFEDIMKVEEPPLLKVVWGSLSSIPAYESINQDLRLLAEHNEKVQRFRRLAQHQRASAMEGLEPPTRAFIERVRAWETARAEGPREAIAPDVNSTELPCQYAKSRLVLLSERIVRGILRVDGRETQLNDRARRAAAKLLQAYDQWPGNGDFTLYNFDIEFRIRRLFHMLYTCPDPPPGDSDEAKRLRAARHALNRQTKLLEVIRNAMERLLDEADFGWEPDERHQADWESLPPDEADRHWKNWADDLWRTKLAGAFLYMLDVGPKSTPFLPERYADAWKKGPENDLCDQDNLTAVNHRLGERLALAKEYLKNGRIEEIRPHPDDFHSVLLETDAYERRMLHHIGGLKTQSLTDEKNNGRALEAEYQAFTAIDARLFPLEVVTGLYERDIISTVRISPLDAQTGFSNRPLEQKVSGDAVSHFGGFFKKSWRSNDILWGRLDGVCQLTETLLDGARVAEVMEHEPLRDAVAARLATDLDPARLFPQSPQATHEQLASWLSELTSASAEQRGKALEAERFTQMTALLIEAAQLEIVREEVPNVIEDAVSEQSEWNQYRLRRKPQAENQRGYDAATGAFYQRGEGDLDPLVMTTAAAELARQAAEDIRKGSQPRPKNGRPADTPLGVFFNQAYKVGSESLFADVPQVVLLEILSTALLVTRNCVVQLWGPRAPMIRKSFMYRVMSAGLWGFDGVVSLLKHGAGKVLGVMAGLAVISVLALLVGITWWSSIIEPKGSIQARWLCAFVIVPVLILLGEVWLLGLAGWRGRADERQRLPTRNPLAAVPPAWARPLIGVCAAAALGAAAVMYVIGPPETWFQTTLLNAPEGVAQLDSGIRTRAWNAVVVDYVFLIACSVGLSLASLYVARHLALRGSVLWGLGIAAAWLALLGGAADAIENAALLGLLGTADTGAPGCPMQIACSVGAFFGWFKWVLPGAALVYCIIGWIRSLFLQPPATEQQLSPEAA